jgi:hypothetical protein
LELDDELEVEPEPEVDLLRASAEVGIVLIATPQKNCGVLPQDALRDVLPGHLYVRGSEGQRNSTMVSN